MVILNSLARLALAPFIFTNLNGCNCGADCSQGPIFFSLCSYQHELLSQIGTDIEDYKCSWLVVQALDRADEDQKRILFVSTFNLVHFQSKGGSV
jgi:hypothetical protein